MRRNCLRASLRFQILLFISNSFVMLSTVAPLICSGPSMVINLNVLPFFFRGTKVHSSSAIVIGVEFYMVLLGRQCFRHGGVLRFALENSTAAAAVVVIYTGTMFRLTRVNCMAC